jgi:hypothetical protein
MVIGWDVVICAKGTTLPKVLLAAKPHGLPSSLQPRPIDVADAFAASARMAEEDHNRYETS